MFARKELSLRQKKIWWGPISEVMIQFVIGRVESVTLVN
jgi:hypothetical protein